MAFYAKQKEVLAGPCHHDIVNSWRFDCAHPRLRGRSFYLYVILRVYEKYF